MTLIKWTGAWESSADVGSQPYREARARRTITGASGALEGRCHSFVPSGDAD